MRLWLLVGILILIAGAGVLLAQGAVPSGRAGLSAVLSFTVVTVLVLLTELSEFHVEVRGHAYSLTLTELPLVLGLFLLSPPELLVARVVPVLALLVMRRATAAKTAFNGALAGAEVGIATAVFAGLDPERARVPLEWLLVTVVVLVVQTFGALAVSLAVSLLDAARPPAAQVASMLGGLVVSSLVGTSMALLALPALRASPTAVVLLAVLVVALGAGYRAYYRLLRRHADLEQLVGFTETVGAAGTADAVTAELVAQAGELLRAEAVSIVPASAADGLRLPAVLSRTSRDRTVRAWLARHGRRDALLIEFHDDDDGFSGVLQVADRIGAATTFTPDDLRLLQTLVAHAQVLLRNGRLVEQLRYEARHDGLTDLANRALFLDRLTEHLLAMQARSPGDEPTGDRVSGPAVLVLDLDRFKEVNDALGHQIGDALLVQVADRLLAQAPADSLVARLGGDEFAVLLPRCASHADAVELAGVMRSTLTGAFEVSSTFLEVGASVGVTVSPEHGSDATTMLRRADVAMYAAKGTSDGVMLYRREHDDSGADRLALAADLRRAVQEHQIGLHYQPKMALGSGRIVGFEALARWPHPQRGMVMPDVFIPLAEHTGVVGPLTQQALALALQECRGWGSAGVGVAVNLSPRRLLEPELAASVGDLLTASGVPAELLTLEITESTIMSDPEAAGRALRQLRDLGVRLSVDDFGTGYSSLAYLQRLPVVEVKIDKSLVFPMTTDAGARAIVRAIVDLGHTLGLTVVAEGVEDDDTRAELAAVGCDVIQGYGLARPMPPERVDGWLHGHPAREPLGLGVPPGHGR